MLSASRLLGYYVTLSDDESTIELRPHTFVATPTDLGTVTIAANPNQITIQLEEGRDVSNVVVRETTAGIVDQVIYRGARRRTCCTLSFLDGNLEKGWDTTTEDAYDTAATADADYPAATEIAERRRRNAAARTALSLFPAYRRFQVPDTWNQHAADGHGGNLDNPVFCQDDNVALGQATNRRWVRLLPILPLKDGIDYTDFAEHGPVKAGLGPWDEQPPMVFSPLPSETGTMSNRRYVQLDRLTAADHVELNTEPDLRDFSIRVEIPQNDVGILLHVDGAPQHAIAFNHFSPLDVDEPQGEWNYAEFAVTVCFEEQRYCEGRHPADADLPALDVIRRKTYYAGDMYRLDRVVPHTIVGVSSITGRAVHSLGGWCRDDREVLRLKAKAAFAYLSIPRRSLSFSVHRVNSAIKLGDYVVSIDSDARVIGSVVTGIALHIVHGDQVDVATQSYGTGFVERDPLKL